MREGLPENFQEEKDDPEVFYLTEDMVPQQTRCRTLAVCEHVRTLHTVRCPADSPTERSGSFRQSATSGMPAPNHHLQVGIAVQ